MSNRMSVVETPSLNKFGQLKDEPNFESFIEHSSNNKLKK